MNIMNEHESIAEQLRISNEKLYKIFQNSPASIIITDIESGKIIDANQTFEQVMGFSCVEVIGKSILDINIWKNLSDRERVISLLRERGFVYEPQLEVYKKSGGLAIVESYISLIRVDGKEHAIAHFIDITNLKQTEQKFSAMFNAIPDAVMLADTERRIVMNNPAVHTMFGYSDEELIGKTTEILYADKNDFYEQGKRRYHVGPGAEQNYYEVEYRRKDGSTFWTESLGTRVNDINGNPIGFIGLFRDITERKQAEHEKMVLQDQLQQSQKMDAIGQLTGGIAHDFNNILAAILGFTNLALRRLEDDEQPEVYGYLKEIAASGERARDLVSQMLAFSRKSRSTAHQIQPSPFISELSKMFKATIPASIEFTRYIEEDVPDISIDPVHLQQVLMNICINARDAIGEKGRIDIHVMRCIVNKPNSEIAHSNYLESGVICNSCHNTIKEGGYVELSVKDTGEGIDREIVKNIFDPFFTTKEIGKGSGMGLSMVHGIVHQHDGHILVDSEPGSGSNFRLLFPIKHSTQVTGISTIPIENQTTHVVDGARILIVDDEKSIARFLGDFIDAEGGKTTVVTDSNEALDLFSKEPGIFDLVITDQTMPSLTGLELSEKLLSIRPGLPIILCTGYSDHVDAEKAINAGLSAYFRKPLDLDELLGTLQALLSRKE